MLTDDTVASFVTRKWNVVFLVMSNLRSYFFLWKVTSSRSARTGTLIETFVRINIVE